jgi:ferritin-like metal-binding protein YciE
MEKMNDLSDLLKHEIEDLYSAEEQIIEALPKMIEKANNSNLKKALTNHLKETELHKNRLDKIMQTTHPENEGSNGKRKGILGGLFGSKHECKGMKGIIEEGDKIMNADISPETLDAGIIACAQKVEHYEITGYGTARTFARQLGMEPIAKQLEQTLNEEYAADDLLTQLAEQKINAEAEVAREGASASSRSRSAGRVREKALREEMEMEAVSSSRSRSAGRNETAASTKKTSGSERSSKPKTSSTPRSEGGRGSSSPRRSTSKASSSRTSGRSSGRSSSGGRGGSKSNSRGRK